MLLGISAKIQQKWDVEQGRGGRALRLLPHRVENLNNVLFGGFLFSARY
jgi:hypothetical protein